MANVKDNFGYLGAMVVGGALGFFVGTMLAPASGDETRRRWGRRLEDEKEHLLRKGQRIVERAGESLEEGIREGKERVANALVR
ncbi:MAG TPA: YtxH domain-containing protein [Vicinamibacteria bacterium]|nr:YtxH domain-containing protein [Vicinamibacteria bacterium]